MATYAIGDIHGCYETLMRLLERIAFRRDRDRLWLTGDLVNRGGGSLAVLRWAVANDAALVSVLGNHDVTLLRRRLGCPPGDESDANLRGVLAAPDGDDLVSWLRARPVIHCEGRHVLVHAGLLPQWSVVDAARLGADIATCLAGAAGVELLATAPLAPESVPPPAAPDVLRLGHALRVMTTIRRCFPNGEHCEPAGPGIAARGCRAWFAHPRRRSRGATIVFGHWAARGLCFAAGIRGIDSACVWGGRLTALRLEDDTVFQQPVCAADEPLLPEELRDPPRQRREAAAPHRHIR
ncbi:MAG: symmetrical bis(5'-nucleosyl)-tetraphosphatase [Candidatus Schekmanbacteria bacterium]|nr:symmetrical bis(5'-nucleosyl)-tetraphosphatase [Candidatus Schekmanbacteria bacterium]